MIWWDRQQDFLTLKTLKDFVISLLIILFGLTTSFMLMKEAISLEMVKSMLISNTFSSKLDCKFYLMLGKDIIVVSSPMVKLGLVSPILWLGTEPTKVLFPFPANKYFEEPPVTKIKINNTKWMFLCSKFIMKKYRIY